jgi:hypothetical protein
MLPVHDAASEIEPDVSVQAQLTRLQDIVPRFAGCLTMSGQQCMWHIRHYDHLFPVMGESFIEGGEYSCLRCKSPYLFAPSSLKFDGLSCYYKNNEQINKFV